MYAMICTVTLNTAMDRVLSAPGFSPGSHVKARLLSSLPAGKGVNVARGLARLGSGAVCCGFAGKDQLSFFQNSLARDGVECRLTPCDGQTRFNTTILDPVGKTSTHLREPGFNISRAELQELQNDLDAVMEGGRVKAVAFCGSLPPGVEAADCLRLFDIAAGGDRELIADISGAEGTRLIKSGLVNTVKPNLEELQQFLDKDVSADDAPKAARELLDCVDTILLTLGAHGACLITADEMLKVSCPVDPALVINTVGCGDAFLAGWLACGQAGMPRKDRLAFAAACAAAAAQTETSACYSPGSVHRLLNICNCYEIQKGFS